ncbi:MAG: glycosyltransferase family 1 protein [Cyanobacteria bacterium P01_D01_bin.2]
MERLYAKKENLIEFSFLIMRIVIVRRAPETSFSMDVYANGLIGGLRAVRPDWEIVEREPRLRGHSNNKLVQKLGKYVEQYWHYPQSLKHEDADIFHIIDHSDGHLAYGLKSHPAAVITTCHDLINLLQPDNANHQAAMPMVSSALWNYSVKGLRAADHVVTVSAHTAKDVKNLLHISTQNLTVVHNAVESVFHSLPADAAEPVLQQYDIPPGRFYLLNVGSSQPRKNIATLLKALAKLASGSDGLPQQPVHLLKAGADFTADQLAMIKTYGLQTHVTHIKNPDKATLVQLYNAADVLVAPSLYEGFGITILEAMACGIPAIASNVSSLPEISGEAAILVDPTDVGAIANAITALQTDPVLYKALVHKGRHHVLDFTWEKSAEQVARVYEKLKGVPERDRPGQPALSGCSTD